MPIDPSTDPAAHDRRTFLTRSAVGGALLSAVALGAPAGSLLTAASAQAPVQGNDWAINTEDKETLGDEIFAEKAIPLELAAVQAYLAAVQTQKLSDRYVDWAQTFSSHHQQVADALTPLLSEEAEAPVPDAALTKAWGDAIAGAADEKAILGLLADAENGLVATHLSAIPLLRDKVTAKTVAQVLCTEAQQGALLATESGVSVTEATPARITAETTLLAEREETATAESDTTTTAAN